MPAMAAGRSEAAVNTPAFSCGNDKGIGASFDAAGMETME